MGKEGDVNQGISGDHNIQINSGSDSVVAIGPGAVAATGDIIVHSGDKDTVEILKKQIQLLENSLTKSNQEVEAERKKAFALEACLIAEEIQLL